MRLAREYGPERLEAACARALSINAPRFKSVQSILAAGLDRHATNLFTGTGERLPEHENVRGAAYYGSPH
jgi:hypothetical protein